MPPDPSNIPQAFHEANCTALMCWLTRVRLGRAAISKLRDCFQGKRRNLPYRFAGTYGGDRKEKIGVLSELDRSKGENFTLFMRWFRVSAEPPEQFGKFSDFVNCLAHAVGDQEAMVTARFSYDTERTTSIFSPIQIGSEAGIFDEVVGFTGIKRDAEGKLLYKLEVGLGAERLEHKVTFFQKIRLSEELPLVLLQIATRVSNLGLRRRDSK
jgi:hypothetical protein